MTKQELWEENILFYREMIDKYKFEQEPMIDLISQLDKEGLCKLCYPSNSHEALGLSLFENFLDRCDYPMVYIEYISKTDTFSIYFQKGQGKTLFKDINLSHLTTSDFEKIKNWLTATAN